ncbi:MAG: beta-ketoacyl-ACP synthase II [Anaerolineales bacterium]
MLSDRVVVTGMGCISPLGNDLSSTWAALLQGESGVDQITHFDTSDFKTKIAAEVKGFNAREALGVKLARRTDRFTQLALVAADQAIKDSALDITDHNGDRIGVIFGTGIGGLGSLVSEGEKYLKKGPRRVSPFLIPMMLPDIAPGQIAIRFGIRGPNMAIVTACASGTNAIGEAAEVIKRGTSDVIIAGGTEAAIVTLAVAGFSVMDAISTRNEDPARASRPFDLNRDGFVIGEGAAALVLESFEHARSRGATIIAEIAGYASSNDAFHISAPAENGVGAAICMKLALEDSNLSPDKIDYINAHGTSTKLNDANETAAIKTVFGEYAYKIPVSSTKSMTGHLLGAAGALEATFCIMAMNKGIIPPTINYETPDPECDLDYVQNNARPASLEYVMSNSFGFGGHNASLVFHKYSSNGAE